MHIILIAGGKGTRLWPLSTEKCSKQFLNIFKDGNSMLQRTYNLASKLKYPISVATPRELASMVKNQLGNNVDVITEPVSHNTFAAFLNIAVYLKYKKNLNDDEFIAILPIDHDVSSDFYKEINKAKEILINSNKDFCLIGIKPTFPSTQYGYILYENNVVKKFIEKPDEKKAIELIMNNASWDSGILVARLKALIDISNNYCKYNSYDSFINQYQTLPKIGFDYEVLEKRNDIMIVNSTKFWTDLGTWENLCNKISTSDINNTNIINTENKEVINYGIKDSIIINTANGLALYPKKYNNVELVNWGYCKILGKYQFGSISIENRILKVIKDKIICYANHEFKNKILIIIDGVGQIIINGKPITVKKGDSIMIKKEDNCYVNALENLEIYEIKIY